MPHNTAGTICRRRRLLSEKVRVASLSVIFGSYREFYMVYRPWLLPVGCIVFGHG